MLSETPKGTSIVLKSGSSEFEPICRQILSELEKKKYSQDDIFAIHLGLEEAFINAVKHGNNDIPNSEVVIHYSINAEQAEFFVTDNGEGFNPDNIPDPREGDNIYKIGGRGLFLIRSYMDLVEFNKRGNCIRMVKYNSQDKN